MTAYLSPHLFVVAHLKMLMYSLIHSALSARSALASCFALGRCSRRNSTSPFHGVVTSASMQSYASTW